MLVSEKQLKKDINQTPYDTSSKVESKSAIPPEEIRKLTKNNRLGKDINLEKRKEMISAKGFEPTEFAYERAIGRNDSLYSNFAELISLTKRKVGRIVVKSNDKMLGYATGFMVSNSLLLTNWHVFRHLESAIDSEVHFFYEYDSKGHPMTPVIFKFDTTKFFNNEELDYCFVAVQPMDVTNAVSIESIGYLFLDKTLGKIGEVKVEKLNIIHHPSGDYKQISIRENTYVDISDTKIFYETDTAQGSSGSPVFNDQWQVVGLHHKSIAKMTADGTQYLDKDDKIIPVIDDKIDITRVVWLRNEGMRISVIVNHLNEKNPNDSVVASLAIPPPPEILDYTINQSISNSNNINNQIMSNGLNKNINISIPVASLSQENSIDISLFSRKINTNGYLSEKAVVIPAENKQELLLLEMAKAEKEQEVDFSKCRGYDTDFLGVNISLPQPKEELQNQIAFLKNRKSELKYFKYSIIFNALTKMPIISAINVEGDSDKRLDDSKRDDDWLKDRRIDLDCQLTDKFYAKSNFDRGHMSRFEDANWDNTEEDALRNGIYTCFYTNACPQVVDLNRAGGLWGKLEKAILEKGIKKEEGKLARMTVFNGPIFNKDKDRLFKGVTIPMDFYKIILWLDDQMKLKATGFKLSQETLVDHINFDEIMGVDTEEALDIDKVVVFKNLQTSIKNLSRLTKIDFSHLEEFDTFPANNGAEEMLIESEEEIMI